MLDPQRPYHLGSLAASVRIPFVNWKLVVLQRQVLSMCHLLNHPYSSQNMTPRATGTSAQFSFELTGNRGAALVTKYLTHNEDSLVDSAFVKYTKQHYESWVKFARDKQYGDDIQPILVSGFDMTRDFAMVAYSYEGIPRTADSTIRVPEVGLTPSSLWGTWRTSFSPHTNSGPQSQSQPTTPPPPHSAEVAGIPSGFDQCVFIRYYSMRSRGPFFMFPKVIRAGAGPHDPGSGDREGDALPRLAAQPEDEPVASGDEDVGVQWSSAAGDSDSETDVVIRNAPSVCHFLYVLSLPP